jgi:hypothetical protein
MRKHHIEAIAQAFLDMRASGLYDSRQWIADVHAIAYVLEDFNPRFDLARFLRACGATTCPTPTPECAPRDLMTSGRHAEIRTKGRHMP